MLLGHIGGNVQRKAGFTHTGAGCQNDQVAAAKAGEHGIQIAKAGGNARIFGSIRAGKPLQVAQRFNNGIAQLLGGAGPLPCADGIDLLLGVFQQLIDIRAFGAPL